MYRDVLPIVVPRCAEYHGNVADIWSRFFSCSQEVLEPLPKAGRKSATCLNMSQLLLLRIIRLWDRLCKARFQLPTTKYWCRLGNWNHIPSPHSTPPWSVRRQWAARYLLPLNAFWINLPRHWQHSICATSSFLNLFGFLSTTVLCW